MADVAPMEGGYSTSLSPASATGGRRHAKKVSAKTIRRTLKRLGMKPKGRVVLKGGVDGPDAAATDSDDASAAPAMGGRRHRKTKKHSRKHRGFRLF